MRIARVFKALLSLLRLAPGDLSEPRRSSSLVVELPEEMRARDAETIRSLLSRQNGASPAELQANPAFRLTEVLSTLPPSQVPGWFKQRFAGEPEFELREFRQLTPAQRLQMLVLVEKALDSRHTRQAEALSRFLLEARRV